MARGFTVGAVIVMLLRGMLAAAPPAGVLDLPDNGFLLGRLGPAPADAERPRTTLLWESPLFEEPVEFMIEGIERIRFPKAAAPAPEAGFWRAELPGDGALAGRLESIDADHVALTVPGIDPAPLRLRRGDVERLVRLGTGQAGPQWIVPGALEGWAADRSMWRELGGRLACSTPGHAAFRELAIPARTRFEIILSWDDRPDFELLLAARPVDASRLSAGGNGLVTDGESYRLESLAGELVAIRESRTAAIDRVATLPAGPGSLHVRVFIDQLQGRMAVLMDAGDGNPKVAFDRAIPPRQPAVRGGFGLGLRSGDVRIDRLRVSPWTDAEPRQAEAAGSGPPGSAIESFDGSTASFTVRTAEGLRPVAAADIAEIVLAGSGGKRPPPAPGMITASFHDGGRLTGWLREVGPESIRLECRALVDPVSCDIGGLAAVEPANDRRAPKIPGPVGVLEADEGRLAGCLADAEAPGPGIAWLACGSVRPVGITAVAHPVRIVYPAAAAPAAAVASDSGAAKVYLKTGDAISCEVIAAGPAGLRVRTALTPDLLVPAIVLRAVELMPAASAVIPRSTLDRLLTLPRNQQADPPTHLLRLNSGDYLRGKLVSLDDLAVVFQVAGMTKRLPRSAVARLIWLSLEGDESDSEAIAAMAAAESEGVPLRATLQAGQKLSMRATGLKGDQLVGESGLLGSVGVGLDKCVRIDLWPAAHVASTDELPYSKWKLRPAALPRALRAEAESGGNAGPAAVPGLPEHELAGKLAAVPIVELFEPSAGVERLSQGWLEGKVSVLLVFSPGDAATDAALRPLQEAVGPLAADGVALVAVAERADRAAVAKAVAGLEPRPAIALDREGILEARLGKDSLPACLIVDREGFVVDVLGFTPEAIDLIRTRAAKLAERTRRLAADFQDLAGAREAALAGDRSCLGPLGRLLDSESELVRRRSISLLRQLTGLSATVLPFKPDAAAADLREQTLRWRQWLVVNGISADLRFPRRVAGDWSDARPLSGRTLVCRGERVLELDEAGSVAFEVAANAPWACDVTPEGRRLVGEYSGRAVIEYDERGKEVWAVRGLPGGPMSARRLENGNTLLALSDANLVAEYDPQGKLAWSVKVAGRPCDARRLPDGNTLVAAHRGNRIVELDASGGEVWAVDGIDDPQTAQRLPDGNTLLAMSVPGIIREIDRDGRTVWERSGFKVPVDVQRLPDGTTLVQEQGGDLVELDSAGTELGRRPTGGNRFLRW